MDPGVVYLLLYVKGGQEFDVNSIFPPALTCKIELKKVVVDSITYFKNNLYDLEVMAASKSVS